MTTTDIVQTPKLVTLARGLAVKGIEAAEVKAGVAAADSLKGIVVTNEAEQASVTDLLGTILRGKRALKRAGDAVLELPKAMTAAVRDVMSGPAAQLDAGERAGKDAVARYLAERRKAAEAEQARLRAEAARAEAEHATAIELNEDAPPPMATPPPQPFKGQARGGSTMLHETKVLKCALVDPPEADPGWLRLDEAAAKNAFRDVLAKGTVDTPGGPDKPVRFAGVDFWYETTLSARADFRR